MKHTHRRLEERFGANAQLGKQRALAELRQRYLEQIGQSAVLDLNHGVLLLLSALSRNPLASEYEPSPVFQQPAVLSEGRPVAARLKPTTINH